MIRKTPFRVDEFALRKNGNPWFTIYEVPLGFNYPVEVVARTNGSWISQKAVCLFLNPNCDLSQIVRGYTPRREFVRILKQYMDHITVLTMRVDRPVYHFQWSDDGTEYGLRSTAQIEIPGGNVEPSETLATAAIREALEETGMTASQVVAWTEAYHAPCANDAGTHVERYGMELVLCVGAPKNIAPCDYRTIEEGISKIQLTPLLHLRKFFEQAEKNGIPIEIWARFALAELEALLYRPDPA